MTDLSQDDTRTIYELSKLTNVTRQIMDDFNNAAIMAMFKEFMLTFKYPMAAVDTFLEEWQENILNQKEVEIEALSNQEDSMINMVVSQKISEQENYKEYVDEVSFVRSVISESLKESIKK